jgi:Haem-degrading
LDTPTQPGGSLYGLNNSNPFRPAFDAQQTGIDAVPGGIITFGGGVALYQNGNVIGGLGVSGDSSCADHAIAFRAAPTGFEQPHCFPSDLSPSQVEKIPGH